MQSEISDSSLKPSAYTTETEILTVSKLVLLSTVVLGKQILAYLMKNIYDFDELNV